MTPHKTLIIGLLLLSSVTAFGVGTWVGSTVHPTPTESDSELRLNTGDYQFINPLLDFQEQQTPLMRRELRLLEESIIERISAAKQSGKIKSASVYYRDLNNGPWIFVNDQDFYTPASLLKVPLMITYFKIAETNPAILDEVILYSSTSLGVIPTNQFDADRPQITVGNSYTVAELISRMITESDNAATLLLNQHVDIDRQRQVYEDFDVPLPNISNDPRKPFITAQAYASFLRILYNATYLNRTYSEKALELLSRSTFTEGLRGGAPPGTKISNKYGVYVDQADSDNAYQLHDCGIIYTKKTFVLCIMTNGNDFTAITDLLSDITHIVYRENSK